MSKKQNKTLLTPEILKQALIGSVKKLDPRYMMKNPVMFVVEIGFFITLLLTAVPTLFGENASASERTLCQRCRVSGRRAGEGPGGHPEEDSKGHRSPSAG